MLKNLVETVKGRKRLPSQAGGFSLATRWPSLDLDEDDKVAIPKRPGASGRKRIPVN